MAQEHRLILKNVDQPGYTNDLDCYVRHGGYEALKKALAIQPKFEIAWPFRDGLAEVELDSYHTGYIDRTGQTVWQQTVQR